MVAINLGALAAKDAARSTAFQSAGGAPRLHPDANPSSTIIASAPPLAAAVEITPVNPPGATLKKRTSATIASAHPRLVARSAWVAATATSKPASAVNAAVVQTTAPETRRIGEREKRVAITSASDVAPKRRNKGPKTVAPSANPIRTPSNGGSASEAKSG